MKRVFAVFLAVFIAVITLGCGNETKQPSEAPATIEPSPTPSLPLMALVLTKENAFSKEFCAKASQNAANLGYRVKEYYSTSGDNQVDNIYSAIGEGAKCIIIEPYDMDNLQVVLEECDAQNIPVINALIPINGIVKMLIAPDYAKIGETAAKSASGLLSEVNILSVEDNASAFVNQLIRDGLVSAAKGYDNTKVAASVITENEMQKAQEAIEKALQADESINTVFAYTEEIAKGAVNAADKTGKQLNIITVGASKEIMELIEQGKIKTAIFFSPATLAYEAVKSAVEAVNGMQIAQFTDLTLEAVTGENVAEYKAYGDYADILLKTKPEQQTQGLESLEPVESALPEQSITPTQSSAPTQSAGAQ